MMLDILQRRFGLVMFVWVLCLIAITLGVKVSASEMAAVSAPAGYPIADIVSFIMGAIWYLTLLAVVVGLSKNYWLERFANLNRRTDW